MPDEHDNFVPSDIPHDVVIQEALAPYLGFEQARPAAEAVHTALVVTYRRAIVEAEDLAHHEEELRRLRAEVTQVRHLADQARSSLAVTCTCPACEDDESEGCGTPPRPISWNLNPADVLNATKEAP